MTHPERVPAILADAVVACNRIAHYIHGVDQTAFSVDLLVQDGVIRQIGVIGEVAKAVRTEDESFFKRHDLDEMLLALAMRNRIIHDYRGVSIKLLWGTATQSVPALRLLIVSILSSDGFTTDFDSLHF